MSLLPFILSEPSGAFAPLIVDSPHSGRIYPSDFAFTCPLPLLRQAEDAFMDEVVSGAVEAGASVMVAEFPRTMVDLNRSESDIDPAIIGGPWPHTLAPSAMTLMGFGLIRRMCRSGVALYDAPLAVEEVQRRIETYYRPYHEALKAQIEKRKQQFGVCYFIDAHSMPDRMDHGHPRVDFILGDRDGASCDKEFTYLVQHLLQELGYSVLINDPYKGREIVQRHGLAGAGAQALQIEINRKLYLDENMIEKHAGFETLRSTMTLFFKRLAHAVQNPFQDRIAAE